MKNKIEIRGVIVDGWYDGEWAQQFIARGLWTPDSRVLKQLQDSAKAGAEIEVYISSQGGSVVAGNEILAAIQGYPHAKSITVGSFAASMAANIILQAKCPVKAHANSILLFHGAWGVTVGGEGAHTDTAELLDQINAPIRAGLAAKGVPQDVIDEGFSEGRQFTMTAADALNYGIVDEIIGEPAAANARMTKEDASAILANGAKLDVAACSAWETIFSESAAAAAVPPAAAAAVPPAAAAAAAAVPPAAVPPAAAAAVPPAPLPSAEETIGRLRAELTTAKAQASAVQSAADKRIAAMTATHQKAISDFKSTFDSLKAEFDAFRTQAESDAAAAADRISTLESSLEDEKKAHAALTGRALLDDDSGANATPKSWSEAVQQFGIAEASRRFPDLAAEYRKTHPRR